MIFLKSTFLKFLWHAHKVRAVPGDDWIVNIMCPISPYRRQVEDDFPPPKFSQIILQGALLWSALQDHHALTVRWDFLHWRLSWRVSMQRGMMSHDVERNYKAPEHWGRGEKHVWGGGRVKYLGRTRRRTPCTMNWVTGTLPFLTR